MGRSFLCSRSNEQPPYICVFTVGERNWISSCFSRLRLTLSLSVVVARYILFPSEAGKKQKKGTMRPCGTDEQCSVDNEDSLKWIGG